MLGLMMEAPLLLSGILEHAARVHPTTEVVARTLNGDVRRYTFSDAADRCRRMARAMVALGMRQGDRIGSLAWNTHEHFELFYGVPGMGAVLHTINPRLHEDQIADIAAHAGDRWICIDSATAPIAERIAGRLPDLAGWITLGEYRYPGDRLHKVISMEEMLAAESASYDWPQFDERRACIICYTSGTTGAPKGVVYSHRSTILSAMLMSMADMVGGYRSGMREVFMPIAPLFHANGWQMPFTAPMNGHKLVLPGRGFEPAQLHELMEAQQVSIAAAVPTIWLSLLDHLETTGQRFSSLRAAMVAGTRAPRSLVERLEGRFGVSVGQTWGMTEAPGVLRSTLPPGADELSLEDRMACQLRQGRIGYGTELRLVDANGSVLPNDGEATGYLEVRGPTVASGYFRQPQIESGGWLPTGDIARIYPNATVEIVDRAKDVIKSGGEWISSAVMEGVVLEHPAIAQAAVISVEHPKWQERPLLIVALREGKVVRASELIGHLSNRVPRWWLPDKIVFVEQLPVTATGKVQKAALRERYRGGVTATGQNGSENQIADW